MTSNFDFQKALNFLYIRSLNLETEMLFFLILKILPLILNSMDENLIHFLKLKFEVKGTSLEGTKITMSISK